MTGPQAPPVRSLPDRKAFKRTKIPAAERVISLAIMGLLGGIAAAVWVAGRTFDPALYSVSTESLKSTEATIEGKSGTLRASVPQAAAPAVRAAEPAGAAAGSPDGYDEAAAPSVPSPAASGEPLEISGATPMGPTEFYSPDTLYEKINGRAPAYLDFRVQQLRCRSFSVADSAGSYVDLYEYRMDSPVNAFGIFALERDPAGKPLDFAPDGYAGDMGFFFRQGNRYVQVIASDQKPATIALARSLAERVAKSIPADDAGLGARKRLPSAGLVPGSFEYTEDNALGQDFLKEVFQATYEHEGKKVRFFLMVASPEAAAKGWDSFLAFSGRYGGKAEVLADVAGAKIFQAQNFGKWRFVYQRGGELGGVIDAEDPAAARAFLDQFLQGSLR